MGSSCNKNEIPPTDNPPQLPPETQTGANTFGCLVNGKVWLPKGGGLLPGVFSDYGNGSIILYANNYEYEDHINLNVTGVFA